MAIAAAVAIGVTVPLWRAIQSPGRRPPGNNVPIDHVVIVLMENRPYDNLFGTYCEKVGPYCPQPANGIPPGTCVPYNPASPSKGCIRPFPFTPRNYSTPDLPHLYNSTIESINGGQMNGFYAAEGGTVQPFGYYNSSAVPISWDLAQEYAIGDNFFSSALSFSLPNHWYVLAGAAPPIAINFTIGNNMTRAHEYLNEANATPTIQDLLNRSSATWKYYDWTLPTYQQAINGGITANNFGPGSAYSFWNPLASRAESYTMWYDYHFASRSQFFTDAATGNLPDISYVIPQANYSDHAPYNITAGESFIASVVDSVEASADWSSTAIFLTWDDYGGWYDHVAPPSLDRLGLSIRVPLVVISPYTPAGLVVHDLGYFESLLRFIEWRFGLGCLTSRDCNAPLPLQYFNFSMTPRAPMLFPTNVTNATYPMTAAVPVGAFTIYPGATEPGCAVYCVEPQFWNSGPPPPAMTETELD